MRHGPRSPRLVRRARVSLPALGLAIAAAVLPGTASITAQGPSEAVVERALAAARPVLLHHLRGRHPGMLALSCLAALHDGVPRDGKALARALARLERAEIEDTYGLALRLMVLAELPASPERVALARRDADLLVTRQAPEGGFGYRPNEGWWDLSNTQYATLGLRAAAELGVAVAPRVWRDLLQGIGAAQTVEGGFGYRPTQGRTSSDVSRTAAGIAVLAVCSERLGLQGSAREAVARRIDAGWAWLARHADAIGDPRTRRSLYFHYGLERAAILTDVERVGEVDWYARGAAMLVRGQRGGGWRFREEFRPEVETRGGHPVDTAFAVLFLRRGFRKELRAPRTGPRGPSLNTLPETASAADREQAVTRAASRGLDAMGEVLAALRSPVRSRRIAGALAAFEITGRDFGFEPYGRGGRERGGARGARGLVAARAALTAAPGHDTRGGCRRRADVRRRGPSAPWVAPTNFREGPPLILTPLHGIPLVGLALVASAVPLLAQAQPFVHPDGRTRWFDVVVAPAGGITWDAAHTAAARAGGALATITAQAENDFVRALVHTRGAWTTDATTGKVVGAWLGGVQYPGAQEPAGSWAWPSLESFSYRAWAAGQPDDDSGADRLHYYGASAQDATWADAPADRKLPGYVVEFDGPRVPRTVGLLRDDVGHTPGYTLYNPLASQLTLLVDERGRLVRWWGSAYTPGVAAYLLPDGHLLRAGNLGNPGFLGFGGGGGVLEEYDWDGNMVWSATVSDATQVQHHDFERLPNGNTIMIVWEKISGAEAIANGRNPALLLAGELWPDKIVEVDRAGRVVWEWRTWDHLVQDFDPTKQNFGDVGKSPDRVDVNFGSAGAVADWMHSNSITYNARLDQILLSVRHFDEVWVLDHSTTTAEARTDKGGRSGKGGRLLYRWGNPRAYRAGTVADQKLFQQHDAHWIPDGLPGAGDILIFSNGVGRPGGNASVVEQITPPTPDASGNYPRTGLAWGPDRSTWQYPSTPTTSFYSGFTSGSQRLPNGNTLICEGWNGRVFEVTTGGTVLWDYEVPLVGGANLRQGDVPPGTAAGNGVFRAPRYLPDFPGLRGRDLTPWLPVERFDEQLVVDGSTLPVRRAPGETAVFDLHQPARPGSTYLLFTSATPGLIPVDYRHVPLGYDDLLFASLSGQAPTVFVGYTGTLDAFGRASARLVLPPIPALVGLELHTGYATIDAADPFVFAVLGNAVTVRIQP